MVESSSLEEGNIIKYIKSLFRLEKIKKDAIDTIIKDIFSVLEINHYHLKNILIKLDYI